MKITLIQMDIKWGDIAANYNIASQIIDCQPGSDLYILPEMFSTGFAVEPKDIADRNLTTLNWMKDKAVSINAAICGSAATLEGDGTYRNRFYFVNPITSNLEPITYYDKHHLFSYGHENECYTAGNERIIVKWRGVRFLLQVCYDLRFPCFSRNHNEYDAVIYVASWPTSRIRVWNTLLQARALENQCYVLGVNRIGTDPVCCYCGGTQCIDAYGRVVAACPDNKVSTITIDLDMEKLQAFRKKFPVLNDAD